MFHPLSAPDARIKEGSDAKRLCGGLLQSGTQRFAADHRRRARNRGIKQIISTFKQRRFVPVKDPPFNKKGAFIATKNIFIFVIRPPVPQTVMPHSLLDLPAREIGIHQHIAGCAAAAPDPYTITRPLGVASICWRNRLSLSVSKTRQGGDRRERQIRGHRSDYAPANHAVPVDHGARIRY